MALNWKGILNVLNGFRNPQQAINWMLDKGAKKDPELAGALKRMINSGQDASKVLVEMSSSGKITLNQLSQIKNYYNMARKMGFKFVIPNEEWIKAEKAIREGIGSSGTQPGKKFTGF